MFPTFAENLIFEDSEKDWTERSGLGAYLTRLKMIWIKGIQVSGKADDAVLLILCV